MRSLLKKRFPRYLVAVGGASELGQAICKVASKRFDVLSIDTSENKEVRWNALYDPSLTLETQVNQIMQQLEAVLNPVDL